MFKPTKKSRVAMRKAVKSLQDYVATYHQQIEYDGYSDETFIKDIVYGVGISIDPSRYSYADGFDRFAARVFEVLRPNPSDQRAGASPAPMHRVVGCERSNGEKP